MRKINTSTEENKIRKAFEKLTSAIVEDTTLALVRSDDFGRRIKGIKSLLRSFSIDLVSKLDEENQQNEDFTELIEKRMKILNVQLRELMKIITHLKGEHRL